MGVELDEMLSEGPDQDPVEENRALSELRRRLFQAGDGAGDLGRYRLLERIGAGAEGMVYAARDPDLDRRVAIKLLHNHRDRRRASDGTRATLLQEARAAARLKHPNAVAVHDVGHYDADGETGIFVVMEFIEGVTLREWIRTARPAWRAAVAMFVPAGRALAAAHEVDIVHRDFKPANVMATTQGRVVVMDFGLAQRASVDAAHGDASGTPAYMAPEQARGESVTGAADQFAFCQSLREALMGRSPDPDDVVDLPCPGWLRAVIDRGLDPDPARRHASMGELVDRLERGLARRRRLTAITIGLTTFSLSLAFGIYGWTRVAEPECAVATELAHTWTPEARSEIRARLESSERGSAAQADALEADVDRYVAVLAELAAQTCERSDDPTATRTLTCLHVRVDKLAGVLSVLAGPPDAAVLDYGRELILGLPDPAACVHPGDEQPASPKIDPEVERRLAAAEALSRAGKRQQAAEEAERVLDLVRAGTSPASEARALLLVASYPAWESMDQALAALENYRRAVAVAQRHGDGAAGVRALLAAAKVTVAWTGSPDDAEALLDQADAWIDHYALDDLHRAGVLAARGLVYAHERRLEEAHAAYVRALEIYEDRFGTDAVRVGQLHLDLGLLVASWPSRMEKARSHLDTALRISDARFGPEHPGSVPIHRGLAWIDGAAGEFDAALVHFDQAESVARNTGGPKSVVLGAVLGAKAVVLSQAGRTDEALATSADSLAIYEASYGSEHLRMVDSLHNHGEMLRDAGRYAEALPHLERALDIAKANHREGPRLGVAYAHLGVMLSLLERDELALEPLRRAVDELEATEPYMLGEALVALSESRLREGVAVDTVREDWKRGAAVLERNGGHEASARARFALARALVAKDEEAAIDLAKSALAPLVQDPAAVKDIEAFLATHRKVVRDG